MYWQKTPLLYLSKKRYKYLISLLIALVLTLISHYFYRQPELNTLGVQDRTRIKVVEVIDGDTIVLETGKKVRYIGIDTPELHHPKRQVECFAREAKKHNEELVLGKYVKLEKDVSETDRFGRLLRYVYVASEDKTDIFVNARLVIDGVAYAVSFPPDIAYAEHFRALQQKAEEEKSGLWRKCH